MKNIIAVLRSYGVLQRLIIACSLLLLVFIAGVIGFITIENYPLLDAIYMTIITMASVGFSEVHPLSQHGKIFTSCLILLSVSTYVYSITVITSFIIEGEFRTYFKHIRVNKQIQQLHGHVIVCGYGRNGRQACQQLTSGRVKYVVVESNPQIIEILQAELTTLFVEGNATEDDVLERAGIAHAQGLITTLPEDAENVFTVLTARELNPRLKIVSRASSDGAETKLKRAGADNVIMPDKIGGTHMAALITKPDVIEFIDFITGKINIRLEEVTFNMLAERNKNKSIHQIGLPADTGANIIGLKKSNGDYVVNPTSDTVITPETKLFVLGTEEQVNSALHLLRHG